MTSKILSTQSAIIDPTPTPIYHCSYFDNSSLYDYDFYDDLNSCQLATGAACVTTTETFPTGVNGTCFIPVSGWEVCATSPAPDWLYSTWSDWCDTGENDGSGEVYQHTRSVLTCSSNICSCNETQVTAATCVGAGCYAPQSTPSACP